MLVTQQLPGRTVMVNGKECLYFSGTSYLGISSHPQFQQLVREGLTRYGTNYGSSRSSNLQLAVYEKAEQKLASIASAESALTFSSGYLAGQAVIHTIDQGQPFVYAPDTHPAIWRKQRDSWHGEYYRWAQTLPANINTLHNEQVTIVANALDPLLAKKYTFDWIRQLPDHKQLTLIIDDSHGFGVTGKEGAGVYQEIYPMLKSNMQLVVVSSLGKAYGIPGGVVFGETATINALKKTPFFTAGSPVPPAYFDAFIQAQHLYQQAREQLKTNVIHFQQQLHGHSLFHYFDHYPVFYTPKNSLAKALEDQCIISSFPYPNPDSQAITRVIISSLHTADDIDRLCSLLVNYRE